MKSVSDKIMSLHNVLIFAYYFTSDILFHSYKILPHINHSSKFCITKFWNICVKQATNNGIKDKFSRW